MSALHEIEGLAARCPQNSGSDVSKFPMATRRAAVLILFASSRGETAEGEDCDVLLVERSTQVTDHPGQIGFPGGKIDPEDVGSATAAALREAVEETGLRAENVRVLGQLPPRMLRVSDYLVTPVLAWWSQPTQVTAVDPRETQAVFRAPIRSLVDPKNRCTVVVQRHGGAIRSRGFFWNKTVIWGFTGNLLDSALMALGWAKPWDRSREFQMSLP